MDDELNLFYIDKSIAQNRTKRSNIYSLSDMQV